MTKTTITQKIVAFLTGERTVEQVAELETQSNNTLDSGIIADKCNDVDHLLAVIQLKNELLEEMRVENLDKAREIRRLHDRLYIAERQNEVYKENYNRKTELVLLNRV